MTASSSCHTTKVWVLLWVQFDDIFFAFLFQFALIVLDLNISTQCFQGKNLVNVSLTELYKFTFTNFTLFFQFSLVFRFHTMFSQNKTCENVSLTKPWLFKQVPLTIFFVAFFQFAQVFRLNFHTLSSQKKKLWKCHSLNNLWSLPGFLSTLFFSLQSFDFFPHKVFTENLVKMFRFGHVTSLTGNWRRQSALTGVLQSVSVLRPEQSAMRLLRSHWKAQQILSNANWVIKRFLCQQRCQIESWILELKKIK